MVPSLTAVDASGVPLTPGLLYGDERGRAARADVAGGRRRPRWGSGSGSCGGPRPRRRARPASGPRRPSPTTRSAARRSSTRRPRRPPTRCSTGPAGDEEQAADAGIRVDQLPRLAPTGWEAARVARRERGGTADGPPLAGGCIDALAEQLVAGADDDGDVLVILGTTLIIWAVMPDAATVPGYMAIPHTVRGQVPGRRSVERGRPVLQLGGRAADRPPSASDPIEPHRVPGLGALPARRTVAPLRPHPPRGARRPRPHPRRGRPSDAPRSRLRASSPAAASTRRREHAGVVPRRIVATGGGHPGRRVGAGPRGRDAAAGRLRRRARRRRARLCVAGPYRSRSRGARPRCPRGGAGRAPAAPSIPIPRGPSRWRSATVASSSCRSIPDDAVRDARVRPDGPVRRRRRRRTRPLRRVLDHAGGDPGRTVPGVGRRREIRGRVRGLPLRRRRRGAARQRHVLLREHPHGDGALHGSVRAGRHGRAGAQAPPLARRAGVPREDPRALGGRARRRGRRRDDRPVRR